MDLALHIIDSIGRLHLKGDRLPREGLDEDLHLVWRILVYGVVEGHICAKTRYTLSVEQAQDERGERAAEASEGAAVEEGSVGGAGERVVVVRLGAAAEGCAEDVVGGGFEGAGGEVRGCLGCGVFV